MKLSDSSNHPTSIFFCCFFLWLHFCTTNWWLKDYIWPVHTYSHGHTALFSSFLLYVLIGKPLCFLLYLYKCNSEYKLWLNLFIHYSLNSNILKHVKSHTSGTFATTEIASLILTQLLFHFWAWVRHVFYFLAFASSKGKVRDTQNIRFSKVPDDKVCKCITWHFTES